MLLFSTRDKTAVYQFGLVMLKWKKLAHSVSPGDKISLYFPSIKIFAFFYQKE